MAAACVRDIKRDASALHARFGARALRVEVEASGLRETLPETYTRWVQRFAALAPLLAARGVDVVNCTPGSALRCFRFADLKDELATSPEPAAREPALQA